MRIKKAESRLVLTDKASPHRLASVLCCGDCESINPRFPSRRNLGQRYANQDFSPTACAFRKRRPSPLPCIGSRSGWSTGASSAVIGQRNPPLRQSPRALLVICSQHDTRILTTVLSLRESGQSEILESSTNQIGAT